MVVNNDPSTEQQAIVIVCIVSPIVSTLFVAIRIWTRTFITHSIGWDDCLALITLPFCITFSILVAIGTNYGFGWHFADISPSQFILYNRWIFISSFVYLFSLGLYKFTILLLYLQLFGVDKRFKYTTWTVMFFVFGYLFTNLLTMIFGCTPIDKSWNSTSPGHCVDEYKTVLAYGSMNFISDVIIFILPLPMVWRLQLSWESKIGVTLAFMGGFIASAVAIVRYALLLRRYAVTDITWKDGQNLIFMVLEVNTGLICSCTLVFKPFWNHFASKGRSQGFSSYPKSNVPLGRRSDTGPLRQNTGGMGFVVLGGNDEFEMKNPHTRKLEVEYDA